MSEKPEALRLAEELDVASLGIRGCLEALSADALLRQHAEIERLKAENAEWQARAATWLASPEAAKRLEGYRKLGEQLAQAEAKIERLKAALPYDWKKPPTKTGEDLLTKLLGEDKT
jgi:hypothetical protein